MSVLIASRNGERYLEESLESLAAQTYPEIEIVAVNDGSSDRTPAILDTFAKRHGRTRVLHTAPPTPASGIGLAASLHLAASHANGRFFARQDDDDRSAPDRIEKQLRFLDHHPEIAVLGTAATRIGPSGNALGFYEVPLQPNGIAAALRKGTPFVHGSVLMRRDAYEASGGYRGAFLAAQDVDLWLRMPNGAHMANLPEPLYAWREHPGGMFSKARDKQLFFASVARAFREERAHRGGDSVGLLEANPSKDAFLAHYSRGDRVRLHLGKALVREGRTSESRELLGAAARAPRSAAEAIAWWLVSLPVEWSPRGRAAR